MSKIKLTENKLKRIIEETTKQALKKINLQEKVIKSNGEYRTGVYLDDLFDKRMTFDKFLTVGGGHADKLVYIIYSIQCIVDRRWYSVYSL